MNSTSQFETLEDFLDFGEVLNKENAHQQLVQIVEVSG